MVAFIDAHRDTYGVEPICAMLPVAPSTYYAHRTWRRDPQRRCARVQRDEVLQGEIRRVWEANFRVHGVPKVWRQLQREGTPVARCTVARLMRVQGLRGAVTKVAMRATILKTADSIEIFVPNKELMTKPVLAMTYSDRMARVTLNIGVAYDSDLDVAERILLETVQRHPLIVSDPAPGVLVTMMDPYSINYLAFGYVREFSSSFRVKSELYQMVRDAFALHKIVIPFPRQDIVVIGEEARPAKTTQLVDPGKPSTH